MDSQAQDIVTWAEQQSKPADSPAYRRMTDSERRLILELHDKGLTQLEIAHRLNRAQSSISEFLQAFADSTDLATRYLKASALSMAENVVKNGTPRDHNQALGGLNVLNQQDVGRISVVINGLHLHGTGRGESDQSFVDGQLLSPSLSSDTHNLSAEQGTAKGNIKPLIGTTESTPSDAS